MLKRRHVGKWLVLIFSVSILFCSFASADDNELNDSKYINKDNSLPNPGSEVLDEIKKDPQFITSRGSFSEVSDDYADIFSNPVYICWDNVTKKDQFFLNLMIL